MKYDSVSALLDSGFGNNPVRPKNLAQRSSRPPSSVLCCSATWWQRNRVGLIVIGCIAVAVVVVVVAVGSAIGGLTESKRGATQLLSVPKVTTPDPEPVDNGDEYDVWDVCQQKVDGLLRAPATAGYPMLSEFTINQSGKRWSLRAWVDAENGFGANVRTYFTCTAVYQGNGYYTTKVRLLD